MSDIRIPAAVGTAGSMIASPNENRPNMTEVTREPLAPGRISSSKAARYLLLTGGAVYLIVTIFGTLFSLGWELSFLSLLLHLSIGTGLISTGFAVGTLWDRFTILLSLNLAGQAASLQMIDAGRLIHFQHFRSFAELLADHPFALIAVGVQAIVVLTIALRHIKSAVIWARETFGVLGLLFVGAVLLFSGVAATPVISIYANGILLSGLMKLLSLVGLILAVSAVPSKAVERLRPHFDRWFALGQGAGGAKLDRFAYVAALWVIVMSSALSYFVYQAHPHVPDEVQYVFQARYIAAGQLTVKPPAVPEAFSAYMVPFKDDRWYGIFPPGWPVLLALGELAGLPWLVNPLLAGMCVLLTYLLFQELYGRGFARLSVVLLCCSPWFIFMAMSLMSHIAMLGFALLGAVLAARGLRSRSHILLCLAGAMVGIVSLIRPLDGAIVGFLVGVWVLATRGRVRERISLAAAYAAGTLGTALLVLPYNRAVTGNPLLMPIDAYYDKYFWPKVMALGFGPERGMGWALDAFPGHSPLEAIINAALNVFQLDTELFGWVIGSLILVSLLPVSRGLRKNDIWAWSVITAVAIACGLFWYHGGPDFGARYWFLTIVPLVALTVRGAESLTAKLHPGVKNASVFDPRLLIAISVLCVSTIILYIPWRSGDKYFNYLGMQPGVLKLSRQYDFGKALVLIHGSEHPDYLSAWVYNPPNFEGDAPIYAFDIGPETRSRLLSAYDDRQVWIVDGPSIANGEYRITEGPIEPSRMLKGITQ